MFLLSHIILRGCFLFLLILPVSDRIWITLKRISCINSHALAEERLVFKTMQTILSSLLVVFYYPTDALGSLSIKLLLIYYSVLETREWQYTKICNNSLALLWLRCCSLRSRRYTLWSWGEESLSGDGESDFLLVVDLTVWMFAATFSIT